jgi:hypothetical protein
MEENKTAKLASDFNEGMMIPLVILRLELTFMV